MRLPRRHRAMRPAGPPTSDWVLLGDGEMTVAALDRTHQPETWIEFWQGAVSVSFKGVGRPLYETLLWSAIGAAADNELEYYT